MPHKCFLVEPVGLFIVEASVSWPGCVKTPWGDGQHHATCEVMRGTETEAERASLQSWEPFRAICEHCGADTGMLKPQSTSSGSFWKRLDTSEIKRRISEFGVGAMWLADWYKRSSTPSGERVHF